MKHRGFPNISFGLTMRYARSGWTLDKRGSLAKVIRNVKNERQKEPA